MILTNNHVINGATKISVTDVGNQKTYTAKVVGYDRSHDIAVLQLQNASGLQTAPLGTPRTPRSARTSSASAMPAAPAARPARPAGR